MRKVLYLAAALLVMAALLELVQWSDEQGIARLAAATPQVALGAAGANGVDPAVIASLPADVNPRTVAAIRARSDVVLIDVRRPDEYASAHIPGSTPIPLDSLVDRSREVPSDRHVLLVCRSGNRSAEGAALLRAAGFSDVHSMAGGMRAWTKAGLAIEAGAPP